MIQIVTDNAADITREEAEKLNIQLIPLSIAFEDETIVQETLADIQHFYQKLRQSKGLPVTSQPTPQAYLKVFEQAKAVGDEVIVITLSSGLSGTLQSAQIAKDMADYDKIYVEDSGQAILAQRMIVEETVKRRDAGASSDELVAFIQQFREKVLVFGLVDTLTYLQKGGRVPKSLAIIGNAVKLKPVIEVHDKVLISLGTARGTKKGKKYLYDEIKKQPIDLSYPVYFGATDNAEAGKLFQQEASVDFKLKNTSFYPIGGIIGTHLGPNTIAICYVKK